MRSIFNGSPESPHFECVIAENGSVRASGTNLVPPNKESPMRNLVSAREACWDEGPLSRKRRRLEDDDVPNLLQIEFPPSMTAWNSVYSLLREKDSVDVGFLQTSILLHLGYTLSSEQEGAKREIVESICNCWQLVSTSPCCCVEESLSLLKQLLTSMPSEHRITEACLKVLSNIMQHNHVRDDELFESLVTVASNHRMAVNLLHKACTSSGSEKVRLYYTASYFLNQVASGKSTPCCRNGDKNMLLFDIGLSLCEEQSQQQRQEDDMLPRDDPENTQNTLLFLGLLSRSRCFASRLSDRKDMLEWLLDHQACETLSHIVTHCPSKQGMVSMLVGLIQQESLEFARKQQCLPGLWVAEQHSKIDCVEWSSGLMSTLESMAVQQTKGADLTTESRVLVAKLLCRRCLSTDADPRCLRLFLLSQQQQQQADCSNNRGVWETALSTVLQLSVRRHGWILNNIGLLGPVAKADDEILSGKVVEIVYALSRHESSWSVLPRQGKLMECLIKQLSLSRRQPEDNPTRILAMLSIWNISSLAANRRLMAKQPGLLSSLIRCVRNMNSNTETSSSSNIIRVSRQDWKERILELAKWL